MKCCLGTLVFETRILLQGLPQKLPILLSLNRLSPCDRQKLDLDTHFHKPALSFLCSDSVGTSLSHVENAPTHICQMQSLKKEVTFIVEVYEKYLHPEKCGHVGNLLSFVMVR